MEAMRNMVFSLALILSSILAFPSPPSHKGPSLVTMAIPNAGVLVSSSTLSISCLRFTMAVSHAIREGLICAFTGASMKNKKANTRSKEARHILMYANTC